MATEIPRQGQSRKALRFQQALSDSIAVWNQAPVSVLDQQAAQAHALLVARGKYITYRKERGELETGGHGSDFASGLLALALVGSTIYTS
jgi:hypothetical protein